MMHMLTVVGARPQIIKAAAISRAVENHFKSLLRETILHTGQHYDENMSNVFFEELGIPKADINLGVGSGGHGAQTAKMLEGIEAAILEHKPDVVLLYGDTNSTLAGAVAASKLHVPVAHVEAGLRSFNKRMPEEVNRIVCDHTSTLLFCPTTTAVENLRNEGFDVDRKKGWSMDHPRVSMCGDVMFDNSMFFAQVAKERSTLLKELGLGVEEYVLATIHRDHNTDVPEHLTALFEALLDVHKVYGLSVVLPLHPRTRKCMETNLAKDLQQRLHNDPGIRLIEPAGFLDMVALEQNAKLVMTDSGGVQKEAFFFRRPCIILRPETEWVELVQHGQAILADADGDRIRSAVKQFMTKGAPDCPDLFGDGHAAEKVCAQILETLS